MPDPLAEALRLQHAAAAEGFDWPDVEGVWAKVAEELAELRAAKRAEEHSEEFGDLLFVLINLARHLGLDPATALAAANRKFVARYAVVMAHPEELPPQGDPARLEAMEQRWQLAKRRERSEHQDD